MVCGPSVGRNRRYKRNMEALGRNCCLQSIKGMPASMQLCPTIRMQDDAKCPSPPESELPTKWFLMVSRKVAVAPGCKMPRSH